MGKYGTLIFVLLLSAAASYWGWNEAVQNVRAKDQVRFEKAVEKSVGAISERLEACEAVLYSARGLFAASDAVDRDEWRRFVDSLVIEKRLPGVHGLGYIARVPRSEIDSFLDAARKDGAPDFSLRTSGSNSE